MPGREVILKDTNQSVRLLYLYYSRTGFCERAVLGLKNELACDDRVIHIRTPKKLSFITAGYQSVARKDARIEAVSPPPAAGDYDAVIVGTPIWAGRIASPLRAALRQCGGARKLYAVMTHSSEEGYPDAVREIEALCDVSCTAALELCSIHGERFDEQIRAFADTVRDSL